MFQYSLAERTVPISVSGKRFRRFRFRVRFLALSLIPFLVFLEFLVFFPLRGIPCFLSDFLFSSRDFRGSVGIKNPCSVSGFPCIFPKKQGRKDRGKNGSDRSGFRFRFGSWATL